MASLASGDWELGTFLDRLKLETENFEPPLAPREGTRPTLELWELPIGDWCTGQDLNLQPSDPKSDCGRFRWISQNSSESHKTIANRA